MVPLPLLPMASGPSYEWRPGSVTGTAAPEGDTGADIGELIRGLRVRMGVGTGSQHEVTIMTHRVTSRAEYKGVLLARAQAMSELPTGGQVRTCDESRCAACRARQRFVLG